MKVCTKCGVSKPLTEFYKDRQKLDGLRPDCKICNNETSMNWTRKNKKRHYGYDIKRKYGISLADYEAMMENQDGKCAICKKHQSEFKTGFHIDHDHTTGKVRALLCVNCNHGIGTFMDNKDLLKEAIKYLEKWD